MKLHWFDISYWIAVTIVMIGSLVQIYSTVKEKGEIGKVALFFYFLVPFIPFLNYYLVWDICVRLLDWYSEKRLTK